MFERSETSPYRVCVLGDIAVHDGPNSETLKPQLRKALAVLVAAGTAGASAERLADEIWTDAPPKSWEASIRNVMAELRNRLGGSGLSNITRHYSLTLPPNEVDLWHFWALSANTDHDWNQPQTMSLLAQSVAFPDLNLSTDLATAAQQHRDTRRHVLRRLVADTGAPLSPPLLRILRSETVRDPFDRWIPHTAALAHARAGDIRGALEIIDLVRVASQQGLSKDLDLELLELRSDLLQGEYDFAIANIAAGSAQTALPLSIALAKRIVVGRQRDSQIRDVLNTLADLDHRVSLVLITGAPGVGKTRFVAGMASILHQRGYEILAGVSPPSDIAFGAFLTALPQLRSALASTSEPLDPNVRGFAFANAVQEIENTLPDRPLVVVLDDSHRLDSKSQQLLEMLLRISTKRSLTFLVAGDDGTSSVEWSEFVSRSRKLAATISVAVEPLTIGDVGDLVSRTYPDAPSTAQGHLGREILSMSAGLPAIANALVAAVDPVSFTLDHHSVHFPYSFSQEISQLSAVARTVLVAAAVLGGNFALDSAATLTSYSPESLRAPVIELLAAGLIIDTETIDEFWLVHGLVADVVLNQAPEALVRQLHIQARSIATDEHDLARHSYAAGPALDEIEIVDHLVDSGHSYAASGAAREAAREFRRVEQLLGEGFPIEHAHTYATVLDLSGAPFEAATVRARTVSRAQSLAVEGTALSIALAGLPEAERANGDTDRVELLLRIRTGMLTNSQRFRHASSLTRQLTLLGRMLSAAHWAGITEQLATTPDQRAEAAYVSWLTRLQTDHPGDRLRHCAEIAVGELSESWRCVIDETIAIDQFELGNLAAARAALARMNSYARASSDALRIWHGELLMASDSFATGNWEVSRKQTQAALATGLRYDITTATAVSIAQEFAMSQLTDTTDWFVEMWDLAPPDIRIADIAIAGHASALLKAGELQRAATISEPLLARVLDRPDNYALPIVATLADVFAIIADEELTSAAVQILAGRAESAILVGAGVSFLGPADRYLAKITGDLSLLGDAIEFADASKLTTWSVALRHEMATITGQNQWRDDAEVFAKGTSLDTIKL